MANPALMVLPGNGSLQGRDRSGTFSAIGAGAIRYAPAPGARINAFFNPSFEGTDITGLSVAGGDSIARSTDYARSGSYSLKITSGNAGTVSTFGTSSDLRYWNTRGDLRASNVTLSYYVYLTTATSRTFQPLMGGVSGSSTVVAPGVWTRISQTVAYSAGQQTIAHLGRITDAQVGDIWYVDDVLLEFDTSSVGTYFDGTSNDAVWLDPITGMLGSAHASPSVSRATFWVEEGTTNLCVNPSFETGVANWQSFGAATISRVTTHAYSGSACLDIEYTGVGGQSIAIVGGSGVQAAVAGDVLAISFSMMSSVVNVCYVHARWLNGTYSPIHTDVSPPLAVSNEWGDRLVFVTPAAPANTAFLQVLIEPAAAAIGTHVYLDAVQVEKKPYATSCCDGSIGTGYAWAGTAHASASTRTGATISMDESTRIDPMSGTLAFRLVRQRDTSGVEPILDVGEGTAGKDRLRIRVNSSDKLEVSWQSNGASETTLASTESIAVGTEYWVYVAWSGTSVWVGIDANALASGIRNAPQNTWGTTDLVVGTTAGSAGFGDLLIADRPLLPAERGAVRGRSPISMGALAGAPYRHFQLRPY